MPAPIIAAVAAKSVLTPRNIKIMVITIVVIIVIVIALRMYKKQQAEARAREVVGSSENEILTNAQTKTDADYEALAEKIFIALDKTVSDETAVVQVVASLKTKSDWLSLVSAFGVKEKGVKWFKTPMNLIGWLTDELSDSNKANVNYSLSRFGVQI